MIEMDMNITEADLTRVLHAMQNYGVATVQVKPALDRAKEPKRMVFAAIPQTTEIAIALEGSGCIILAVDDRVNDFRFIEAGFQIGAARIAVALFSGLAGVSRSASRDTPRGVHQLEDKRS